MDRHKPEDIHSKIFEARDLSKEGFKSALGSALTHIHFINHRIAAPFRMIHSCGSGGLLLRMAEKGGAGSQHCCKNFFHDTYIILFKRYFR